MEEWQPATIEEVKQIVEEDLRACDPQQLVAFKGYEVEPYVAPIVRFGKMGSVVVVARNGDDVIYWEDVEGGNVSPVDSDGRVIEHWCNQDELGLALNAWIDGRGLCGWFGPAQALDSWVFERSKRVSPRWGSAVVVLRFFSQGWHSGLPWVTPSGVRWGLHRWRSFRLRRAGLNSTWLNQNGNRAASSGARVVSLLNPPLAHPITREIGAC